jgi:hypothetical protein
VALQDGDRVTLDRDRRPSGRVVGGEHEGRAYVKLDNGTAATFPTADLRPEDKAWPPSNLEGK